MSQNQNKQQNYAHAAAFIGGGFRSGPRVAEEQKHGVFNYGGSDYPAYWQGMQQQVYQQQHQHQQQQQQHQRHQYQQYQHQQHNQQLHQQHHIQQQHQQHNQQRQQQPQNQQQHHQQQQHNQQQHNQQQHNQQQHSQQQHSQQQHNQQQQRQHNQQQGQHNQQQLNIKFDTMDTNILAPTIEMEELIIKTEPPDDAAPVVNLVDPESAGNADAFHRSTAMSSSNNIPYQLIKEEPTTSQQKSLNFPRRKLQTERSETLPICQRCKQVFLKKSTYVKHVRLSSCSILEYNFKCLICPMSFMSPEELQAHENVHRANQFFCQKYCGKYFDTLDLCEAHEFMFHYFELFVCNVCISTYHSRDELFTHKTQHRHLIRFDCPVCRRWFTSPNELRRHRLEAPFNCGKFYTEGNDYNNESYYNNMPMNQPNYSLQDCNIGVMECSTPPNISNTHINHNPIALNSNAFANIPIKTEPVFEQTAYAAPHGTETFSHNSYTATPNYNNTFSNSTYNELNNPFQAMERRYANNFNFTAPYTPATPAVNEADAICCVPNCGLRKSSSPTLQFFKYPKDIKYLKQWLHNMKLIYHAAESYEDYRICSLHFPKRVINLHSLCYWAVPTFHLGHEDSANIYHNRDQNYVAQPQCSMPGCDSQRGKTNLKFFNFPTTDSDTYIKWCQNTRLPHQPLNGTETRQLCSRHFEDQCFGKIRLKVWAVPTLHLGGFPRIHDNPRVPMLEVKKCCLSHCRRKRSEDPSLSLYSFPRDEAVLQRWCYNLKLDPNEYRGKFHKVCSAHFIKDVIGSIKLQPGAVPTLHLGHNDPNIYNNDIYTITSSSSSKNTMHSNSSISSSSSTTSTTVYETPDTCSLPSCKRNRYADSVSMHTMPGRPEMLEKWCHNLKLNPQKIPKHFRVCSIHFEPYCIGGCMRPFAVPTLMLGHDDPNIHHNPKIIKKLHIRETCCVPTCRRNRDRDKANLHRFPLHKPELLQKWLDNLRRPMPDGTRLFNDAICERHFESRCIRIKRLERWALPTLELGHDEEITPLPSEAEVEEIYLKQMAVSNSAAMATECCVSSCQRNPKNDDVKLYPIPDDESILAKWSHNLQQDLTLTPSARICNLHFELHCIGKRLHAWAIPTLNLPQSSAEVLFENPKEMTALSSVKMLGYAPRCCLPHCRKQRSDGKVHLFRFPSYSKSMLKKWCHNLQISIATASSSHRRVCSSHFEPHVLTKRCPMPNSMPTLELNVPPGFKIYQNPEKLKLAKLRTERLCVIPSCRKSRADGVQLFLYPHNRVLLRKWAYNTKQKPGECSRGQFRVCSEHFEENCFGPVRLCLGAIPTLKLGHDDPDIFQSNLPPLEEQEMQCVIAGCGRSRVDDGVKLFRFPCDDEDMLWKWCNNLKLNPVDCQKTRICNLHFESMCVGPRGLFRWAIPTMLLGHNDAELQLHLNPKPEDRFSTEQIFKCCVTSCGRSRKYDEAQLNSFPKTSERFYRWTHNLRLNLDFADREKYRICNEHFERQCIGKQRLHYGAIPTLQLGHDGDDIYQVDPEELQAWYGLKRPRPNSTAEKPSIAACSDYYEVDSNKCCYPGCMATKSALRESYAMPKQPIVAELWIKSLQIDPDSKTKYLKLCGLHFIELYEQTSDACKQLLETHSELEEELQVLATAYAHSSNSSLTRSMSCSVPDCKITSLSGEGIKLYQFPYNRELCEKWCFNTGVELDETRRHLHKVCTQHFDPHCLTDAQRLRPWAVPTLKLPQHADEKKLHQNPDLVGWERRLLGPQSSKCCVPNCVNNTFDADAIKLFNFPTDTEFIDKWLHNLQGCVERDKCPLYKICSLHFEAECLSKMGRLRSWSIPTLKLGHNDTDLELYQNHSELNTSAVETPKPDEEQQDLSLLTGCKIKRKLDLIKCCVSACRKSRLQHGVRFFDFPTESKMLKRWCFNLQLPVATPKELQHICNQHFEKRCFVTNKELYAWALPTLNLGHPTAFELHKNPKISVAKVSKVANEHSSQPHYLPICCVPKCGRRRTVDNNLRTFGFPKQPKLMKQWCDILKIDAPNTKGSRVCVAHFSSDVRFKTKLKKGALPLAKFKSTGEDDDLAVNESSDSDANNSEIPPIKCSTPQPTKSKRCCIPSCRNNRTGSSVRLFAFPKPSQLLLRKWCHNTQQPFKKRLRLNICALHFEKHALHHNKPRPWAIPTLHLGHQQPLYNNSAPNLDKDKCCVLNCRVTTPAAQLFSFPKRSTLLRKWAHNTKQDGYLALRRNYKVCSRHFEPSCKSSPNMLSFGAIPTLHLGHNAEDNYANEVASVKTSCDIVNCSRNTTDDGIKLFSFPTDNVELLEKWCHNLKLQPKNSQQLQICNLHFEQGWVGKQKLIVGAMPTQLLGHKDDALELYYPETTLQLTAANTPVIMCCVPNCGKTRLNDDVHMISFPKNRTLYFKWLHNLKLGTDTKMRSGSKVCSDHFEDYCKVAFRIRLGAIPTLNLGHNDPDIHQNSLPLNKSEVEVIVASKCSLTSCHSYKQLQIQLFDMPTDQETLERWCKLEIENYTLNSKSRLCGLHFMTAFESRSQLTEDGVAVENDNNLLAETYNTIYNSPRWRIFLCSIPGCHTKCINSEGIKLMKFPQNPEMFSKWSHNTNLVFDEHRRYLYKVCALHFEERCFGATRIRPWALPTLKLNNSDSVEIYQNPEEEEETQVEQQAGACCVQDCNSSTQLWRFPNDTNILQRWCHNLQLSDVESSRYLRICSVHFEGYCIGKRLRHWAIPTLKLNVDPAANLSLHKNPAIQDLPALVQAQICCVSDCRQQRDDNAGIKLFKFPLKSDSLQKWQNNLKLNMDDCKNLRICNLHFEQHCCRAGGNKNRLPGWALPTLNLGYDPDSVDIIKNPKPSSLLQKCCLPHCRKRRRTSTTERLHRFPESDDVRQKWLHNLRLTDEQLEQQSASKRKLCSAHFEQGCFLQNELRHWALPTLELGHQGEICENQQLHGNSDDYLWRCCVPQCEASKDDTQSMCLFGFPKCPELLQKWCDNLRFPRNTDSSHTKRRVCAAHFEPNALNDRTYWPDVVPTRQLGHDEPVMHQNPDLSKYLSCSLTTYCNEVHAVELFECPKRNASYWQLWRENLKISEDQSNDVHMLCSAHFVPAAIMGHKLKPGAVPTLKLGHSLSVPHKNPDRILNQNAADLCTVALCAQEVCKLFDFPNDPKLLKKWCSNLKLEAENCVNYKICCQHFAHTAQVDLEYLPNGAVPTLHLGHNELIAFDNAKPVENKGTKCCCIATCPGSNEQLYRFPKINWLLQKWCYNLRIAIPTDAEIDLRICADHFERHCVGLTKLKPWALPTLALGHEQHIHPSLKLHKYHAEEKACGEMQFVRSNYCAIVSCLKSKQDGVQLFGYPKKGLLLRKWAHNCKHNAYQAARYSFRICSTHFDEHCLTSAGTRLRVGAIPMLNLGHNDDDIYHHDLEAVANTCATPSTVSEQEFECRVPGCVSSKQSENVRFFRFPKDPYMLQNWCHNLRLVPQECTAPKMRICSIHFEERCLGERNLRPRLRALPTLFLGHNDADDIIANPESFERPENITYCCVPECGKSKQFDNVLLYGFPRNRKLFEQWIQNLRLTLKPTPDVFQYYRVCCEHFEDFCIGTGLRRLLFGAIPTLKLGHDDLESIHRVLPDMLSTTPYEQKKRKKVIAKSEDKCCQPDCQRTSAKDVINFYSIPKHPKLEAIWLESLGIQEDEAGRLCMMHFKIFYDYNYENMLELSKSADESDEAMVLELDQLAAINDEVSNSTRIRGMFCSVPGCSGNTLLGEVKLHTFPYNRDLHDKWSHNTQIQVVDHQRYLYKVCSLHFEPHAIAEPSKRLRPWALPTLNLPPHIPPSQIIPNPDLSTLETRCLGHVGDKLCCIPSCTNAQQCTTGTMLYKFPRYDPQLFNKWLYNTQLKTDEGVYARICSRHFEPLCIGKRMRTWALPTLHLGHDKPDTIHQNPAEKLSESIKEEETPESKFKIEPKNDAKLVDAELKHEQKNEPKNEESSSDEDSEPLINRIRKKRPFKCETNNIEKTESFELSECSEDVPLKVISSDIKNEQDIKKLKLSPKEEKITETIQMVENPCHKKHAEENEKLQELQEKNEKLQENNEKLQDNDEKLQENDEKLQENNDDDSKQLSDQYTTTYDSDSFMDSQNNINKLETTLKEIKEEKNKNYYGSIYNYLETSLSSKDGLRCNNCRIENCNSRMGQPNVVLHKLPSNPLFRKRWLHNSQISFDANRPWGFKICSRHFARHCYNGQRLIQWAVPTLHLGSKRPSTIYTNTHIKRLKDGNQAHLEHEQAIEDDGPSDAPSRDSSLSPQAVPQAKTNFNFKITAIESINIDTSHTESGGGSLSSNELPTSATAGTISTATTPTFRTSTSNLTCSLPSCQRRTNDDFVQLHMLPKDSLLQHKWCHNCRLTPLPNELYITRVCSYHFEQQCFTRTRRQLKLGSVPTLHLGHNQRNIYRNARTICESFTCCVTDCGRRRLDNARHFRFPSDKRLLAKWLHNLQMEFNAERPWTYNVCELHFEDYCFGKAGSLLPWAVPTLRLGAKSRSDLRLNERPPPESNEIDDDALFILPECSLSDAEQFSFEKSSFNEAESFNSNEYLDRSNPPFSSSSALGETKQTLIDDSCKCQIPLCGCIQTKDNEVRLFSFPKDYELRQKWIFNTKLNHNFDEPNAKAFKICERHFEPNMLSSNNDVLRKSAVPTLFLGHNDNNIFLNENDDHYSKLSNTSISEMIMKKQNIKSELPLHTPIRRHIYSSEPTSNFELTRLCTNKVRCFLKHCKLRRGDGVKLFRFPRETELQLQWEHNLKIGYDSRRRHRHFLCSRHFEPELIGRKFLLRGAIPTLDLGHNDVANIIKPNLQMLEPPGGQASSYTSDMQKQLLSCCVKGCGRNETSSDDVLLFPFPTLAKYSKIWQKCLKIDEIFDEMRVCSRHFERYFISRRLLANYAVPTLHLPPSTTVVDELNSGLKSAPACSSSSISTTTSAADSDTCSVPNCTMNSRNDNVKIFSKFPADFELFTKWCFNLKIDPRKYVDGTYKVCSAHFEPYCIGGHSLRLWAVPTLNLGHADENIHQVKRPAEMEIKCCLPHCGRRRSSDNVTFHNFPKGDLYKTWCKILQIDELLYRNTDKKICSAHFTADCFIGSMLKGGVRPSLHLTAEPKIPTLKSASNPKKMHSSLSQSTGCIVLNCLTSNRSAKLSSTQLFTFPENRNLCNKWLHNLKLSPQPHNYVYTICSKHFEPNCIYNGKLHAEAIPTLALGHADVNIFSNTGSFTTSTNDKSSSSSSTSTSSFGRSGMATDSLNDFSTSYVKQEEITKGNEDDNIDDDALLFDDFFAMLNESDSETH